MAGGKFLNGTAVGDNQVGSGFNDLMLGHDGNDVMLGGGGNDNMHGGAGDDLMLGESKGGGKVDLTQLKITEDVTASVTFDGETAGYRNALGLYTYDSEGQISGVKILWANASLEGAGGDLISGSSIVNFDLSAGDRVGFFVVPNGYDQAGMAALLADPNGTFLFLDPEGNKGNINGAQELTLVHVGADGTTTDINSQYGTSVFHSTDDGSRGLNADGLNHTVGTVNALDGTIKIGIEDLMGGGDNDFDDSTFTLNIGTTNATLVPKPAHETSSQHDDTMLGGAGNDKMLGMSGNDIMGGGTGDDALYGNSGVDMLWGEDGNDTLSGGKQDDHLWGEAGDDTIAGNSGNDRVFGGAGHDTLEGNSGDDFLMGEAGDDKIDGGSGNDVIAGGEGSDTINGGDGDDYVLAASGNDYYRGGSGVDTLDYSEMKGPVDISLATHVAQTAGGDTHKIEGFEQLLGSAYGDRLEGDKRDNTLLGGAGDDWLHSGRGHDILRGGEGSDTFAYVAKDLDGTIDHIADFELGVDHLDLSGFAKPGQNSEDIVHLEQHGAGTMVQVMSGGVYVDVALLENIDVKTASSFDILS